MFDDSRFKCNVFDLFDAVGVAQPAKRLLLQGLRDWIQAPGTRDPRWVFDVSSCVRISDLRV